MWTGQKTLQSIDAALGSANNDITRLDSALSELTQRQTENRRDQVKACEDLASLRLDQLSREKMQSALSYAETTALAALEKRQRLVDELEKTISINNAEQLDFESQRERQAAVVDRQAQVLIDCERSAQAELETDEEYQRQLESNQVADAIADRAEEKTALAEQDRTEKGKPFEGDALFMYLWRRHYGQPEYKANFLARFLDNWVARLCDYAKARVNYWMLLELPKRLRLHAESVREAADNELLELQKIEHKFAEKHDVLTSQSTLAAYQQQLDAIDQEIESTEENQHKLLVERTAFNAGEDSHFKHAIHALATAMQRKDIAELQRLSNRTLDRQDDHLVASMIDLREEEKELQQSITETRKRQQAYLEKLSELKRVRTQFKRKRFDDVRSGFNNGSLIGVALNEFLKGVLNNGELWRTIERSQRHRDVGAWPDFGSGGLGGGQRGRRGSKTGGSPWHWPGSRGGGNSRSSGGGFRLPRAGGSSSRGKGSGGFRTGGGF